MDHPDREEIEMNNNNATSCSIDSKNENQDTRKTSPREEEEKGPEKESDDLAVCMNEPSKDDETGNSPVVDRMPIEDFVPYKEILGMQVKKLYITIMLAALMVLCIAVGYTLLFMWQANECLQEPRRHDLDRRAGNNGFDCFLASIVVAELRGIGLYFCQYALPLHCILEVPIRKIVMIHIPMRIINTAIRTAWMLDNPMPEAYGTEWYTTRQEEIFNTSVYFFCLWFFWDKTKYVSDWEMHGLNVVNTINAYVLVVWPWATALAMPAVVITCSVQMLIIFRFVKRDLCQYHNGDLCWSTSMIAIISVSTFTLDIVNIISSQVTNPLVVLGVTMFFFKLFGTIGGVWTANLCLKNRYTAASISVTYMFVSEYVAGLSLVYNFATPEYSTSMLLFIALPIFECSRDSILNAAILIPGGKSFGMIKCKSEELLWWEECHIHKLQSTLSQALSAFAVFMHVVVDYCALQQDVATTPMLRCRIACLGVGECLMKCDDLVANRLWWGMAYVVCEAVGATLCVMANGYFTKKGIAEYFELDKRGKAGKEKAGYAPTRGAKYMVATKEEKNDDADFISQEKKPEMGPFGHPYTHLPPRVLEFGGDIDRMVSYHFWRTKYWMLFMILMPLPYIYLTQCHSVIPVGPTRAADGITCYAGGKDQPAIRCYAKLLWFLPDEVLPST